MCSPAALAKEATFLAVGTVCVLAWERQPQVAVLLQGVPWWMEQMEVMEVMPQPDVVGSSQILLEGLWNMMQGGLTGRKEVMMTFTFLP